MPDAMPGDGAMSVFGINILSDIEYKMLTRQEVAYVKSNNCTEI